MSHAVSHDQHTLGVAEFNLPVGRTTNDVSTASLAIAEALLLEFVDPACNGIVFDSGDASDATSCLTTDGNLSGTS